MHMHLQQNTIENSGCSTDKIKQNFHDRKDCLQLKNSLFQNKVLLLSWCVRGVAKKQLTNNRITILKFQAADFKKGSGTGI